MANNTITGSLNNGYIRYASKEEIADAVKVEYTEDEKLIGSIMGLPLYRKVFEGSGSDWYDLKDVNVKCIYGTVNGWPLDATNIEKAEMWTPVSSIIRYRVKENYKIYNHVLIIEYTKIDRGE